MRKSISDAVLKNLAPRTYYRACDVAKEMSLGTPTVSSALRGLAMGGLIERFKEKNRVVYIARQERLF